MEIKKQANFNENYSLRILEKFAEIKGIPFDSIQAISELEQFRRLQSDLKKENHFEELAAIGKKMGIFFLQKEASMEEILPKVYPSFPVAVFTKDQGWILINSTLGPFVRFTRIATSDSVWTLKSRLKKSLDTGKDNGSLSQWILLDQSFHRLGMNQQDHPDYLKSIFQLIQMEKNDIWAIAIYSVAMGILSLIIPIGVQSLVNILNFGTLFQPVLILTFLVIIALGFVGLMNVLQSYVAELIQQRLFVRLAANVTNLFPRVNHHDFKKYYASEMPNYFLDISIIQKSATILLTNGLGIFLQTLIGLLVLVLYHPFFILFNVLILAFVIGIIFYSIGSVGIETSIKESKSKHKVASWIQEMNFHRTVFRSERAHNYASLRTENLVREYISNRRKHFKALMRQMIGFVSLQAFGSGLLLGIGGWLVIKGQITLGQLVASEIIVAKILDNFGKFTKYLENYYDLCASVDKVNHLLDFSLELSGSESPSIEKESPISIRIEKLNMQAEKGEIVVIRDPENKTAMSLVDMLYGFKASSYGSIAVNNTYLQDMNLREWRNHISLLRDIECFSGSIADNVKLNSIHASSTEIRNALDKVNLMKRIQDFPNGIQSELLRNGYPFTKEELALLVIARALLDKPALILIDEILIYLSKESISLLVSLLKELKKHSTILISSMHPDFQTIADRVYTFKDGELIEKGKVKS
ncbi:MAG: ABC transporter ATP-binding protein [Leptospiraceae bacterium]|nr:ABC transporter ATP-binding protein [Leptospiraceae bacterium]